MATTVSATNDEQPAMIPRVGDMVLFTPLIADKRHNFATVLPAVVVRTFGTPLNLVNLRVFNDGPLDGWEPSVPYDEGSAPRTWKFDLLDLKADL